MTTYLIVFSDDLNIASKTRDYKKIWVSITKELIVLYGKD